MDGIVTVVVVEAVVVLVEPGASGEEGAVLLDVVLVVVVVVLVVGATGEAVPFSHWHGTWYGSTPFAASAYDRLCQHIPLTSHSPSQELPGTQSPSHGGASGDEASVIGGESVASAPSEIGEAGVSSHWHGTWYFLTPFAVSAYDRLCQHIPLASHMPSQELLGTQSPSHTGPDGTTHFVHCSFLAFVPAATSAYVLATSHAPS